MSKPEDILSRWSRLKLGSAWDGEASPAPAFQEPTVAKSEPSETTIPAATTFDQASLPPIESITASTDIRSFLQSGVPAALTRSALRRAWVTDPAIRDFIGIAESQWDFNDPTAMPGFGPLRTDEVARLADNMLGSADDTVERIAQVCAPSPQITTEMKPLAGQDDGSAGEEGDARR